MYLFGNYESACSWLKILWENTYDLAVLYSRSVPMTFVYFCCDNRSVTAIPVSNLTWINGSFKGLLLNQLYALCESCMSQGTLEVKNFFLKHIYCYRFVLASVCLCIFFPNGKWNKNVVQDTVQTFSV